MYTRTLQLRLLLCTLLFACGDAGEPKQGLAGRDFLFDSADGFAVVAGGTIRLSFRDDALSLSAGCNSLSGNYRVAGTKLDLTGLSSTEKGCEPALHAQDEQLADFFAARPSFRLDGDRLELASGDITLRFLDREVADPDRPLIDTHWEIDSYIEGDGVGNAPAHEHPTVHFASDGTVHVQSTCNGGSGRYTVQADRITLEDVAYSEEGCNDPVGASVEQKVQAVLRSGTLTYEIEARRLTLLRGEIGLSAQAR